MITGAKNYGFPACFGADDETWPSDLFGFQTDGATMRAGCGSPTFQLSNAHHGRR